MTNAQSGSHMGSNCAVTTVLCYDPAGSYSMKVLWREDMLHQVSNVIMVNSYLGSIFIEVHSGSQVTTNEFFWRGPIKYQLMNFFGGGTIRYQLMNFWGGDLIYRGILDKFVLGVQIYQLKLVLVGHNFKRGVQIYHGLSDIFVPGGP